MIRASEPPTTQFPQVVVSTVFDLVGGGEVGFHKVGDFCALIQMRTTGSAVAGLPCEEDRRGCELSSAHSGTLWKRAPVQGYTVGGDRGAVGHHSLTGGRDRIYVKNRGYRTRHITPNKDVRRRMK
ncbi:unnamed protein product [Nippostrongylus brasiliensis]|uniref:Uncharacterized protein n=1 Tax=Nippostrongylus brasiliensis TaxID=27835 RepID=A0A0N4YJ67_NIPBR|nr:unnamed protein product [Nippostrongylus brasiliensis]